MCVVVQFEHLKDKNESIAPVSDDWQSNDKFYQRTQLPLTLTWGLTIHKAQGQTMSAVVIQVDKTNFAAGLLYVALSRVHALGDFLIDVFEESYFNGRLV